MQPYNDRVVIRPLTDEEAGNKRASGIIVASNDKAPGTGIVVAVGPGTFEPLLKKRVPIELKPGDRVYFSKYNFEEISAPETLYIVEEKYILCTVK